MALTNPFRRKKTDPSTSRKTEDRLDFWKQQIRVALDMRSVHEDEWHRFTDIYHAIKNQVTNENIMNFNTHKGHQLVSKMVALLTARDPKWDVISMSNDEGAGDQARFLSNYLAWVFYKKDVREDVLEPFVLDIVITGTGLTEVGFKEDPQVLKRRSAQDKLQEQAEIGAMVAEQGLPEDVVAETIAELEEMAFPPPDDTNELNLIGETYYQYVDVWDFLISPGATSIENAYTSGGWVAKRIVLPLSRAMKDFRYKNRNQFKPTRNIKTPRWDFLDAKENPGEFKTTMEFVELWQISTAPDPFKDKKGEVLVLSMESDKFHWEGDDPYPEIDGFTYSATRFKPVKGGFWGIPYLRHLGDTLDAFDLMRAYQLDIARTKKNILVGQKGIHDEADTTALAETPAGTVILLDSPEGFRSLDMPGASQELINEVGLLAQELVIGSNLGAGQSVGLPDPGSATQASIIQSNITTDIQFFDGRIQRMLVRAGRKFVKITQTKGDPSDIVRAANIDGGEYVEFSRSEIQGEFDLRIGIGTMVPFNREVRRKQLIDLFATAVQLDPGSIRANRLLLDIFREFDLPAPHDYVVDKEAREQHLETLIMFESGEVVPVDRGDPHIRHLQDIALVREPMFSSLQANEVEPEKVPEIQQKLQLLDEHGRQHQIFIGQAGGGGGGGANRVAESAPGTQANVLQSTLGSI